MTGAAWMNDQVTKNILNDLFETLDEVSGNGLSKAGERVVPQACHDIEAIVDEVLKDNGAPKRISMIRIAALALECVRLRDNHDVIESRSGLQN